MFNTKSLFNNIPKENAAQNEVDNIRNDILFCDGHFTLKYFEFDDDYNIKNSFLKFYNFSSFEFNDSGCFVEKLSSVFGLGT